MKQFFILFIAILTLTLALPASSQPTVMVLQEYGFRGVTFEENITNYPDLVLKEKFGYTRFYVNPKDELQIAGQPLASIVYCFHKDQLNKILLETSDAESSEGILAWLNEVCGPGMKSYRSKDSFYWTHAQKTITYHLNPMTNRAIVTLTSQYSKSL
jgi:hypothetical protein